MNINRNKYIGYISRNQIFPVLVLLICVLLFFQPQTLSAADLLLKNTGLQSDRGHIPPTYLAEIPEKPKYFKINQGFSYSRLLDQRMSNLHYTGVGGFLSFSRFVIAEQYMAEWSFARLGFQVANPQHKGTSVSNPSIGIRYMHLRKLNTRGVFQYHVGGQADLFANIRMAPLLSNSYLYAEFVGEIMPRADINFSLYLFDRDWELEMSVAAGLLGYAVRIPEYGASYQLGSDGSETLSNNQKMLLHPGNFNHFITGFFVREPFGKGQNPNFFRVGYVWDFFTIRGQHDLNLYNANHQLVLKLYFMVN